MWISKAEYLDLRDDRAEAIGRSEALEKRVYALETSNDWLRVQFSKCDIERAALIQRYLGVQVPTIRFEEDVSHNTPVSHIINDAGQLFADVGDKEAIRLGVGWDDDGNYIHGAEAATS
jgi:hypothetical protein